MVYWYFIVHLQFLFAGLIPCLGKLDFFLKNITDPYFLQTKKKTVKCVNPAGSRKPPSHRFISVLTELHRFVTSQ